MRSTKLRVPRMVLHRASGQAVVVLPLGDGKRRMVYLGPWESADAKARYREVIAEHVAGIEATTATAKAPAPSGWPTVGHVVRRFLEHADQHYRDAAGVVSREVVNFRLAARPLLDVLRDRTTDGLTCADLAEVRRIRGITEFGCETDENDEPIPGTGRLPSRSYVNSTLRRIKSMLRWGTENGMVPGDVWHALTAFRGLGRGRGGLRETEPVEAVSRALVDAVLPHLPPILATAVELLWWSGMRAGELCNLRMRDVERGTSVWLFRPATHKGTWKGRERIVRFGPRCQELLRPLLTADPDAYLFTPTKAMSERKAAWRAARKTKVQPSQKERDEKNARKANGYAQQFDVATLRRALHRACDDAGVPHWGLHRLRHAAGTRLVLAAGDDAARVQLGHADDRMVRRYSRAADSVLGANVAARHA